LLLAYQKAQFGAPLIDGYRVYEPEYRALYGEASRSALSIKYLIDPEQIWHHLDALRGLLLDWTLPGSILLFALGAVVLPRNESASSRMRDLTVGLLGACVLGFLPTLSIPDDGPPTRYLSPALLPIALLSGPGWIAFRELLDARIGALGSLGVGSVAIGLSVASFASVLDKRLPLLWEREGLSREVAARGLRHAVVLVHAQFPTRYTRNGTTFDNSVLYVRPDVATPQTLALWFPGRSVHEAVEGRMWTLLPVQGP
jgi:hypothetical protein